MSHKPLPIVKDKTGLSVGYRLTWWLQFLGFFVMGPADQMPHMDPKERLKRERAVRVMRAHEARGTEVPQEVRLTAADF